MRIFQTLQLKSHPTLFFHSPIIALLSFCVPLIIYSYKLHLIIGVHTTSIHLHEDLLRELRSEYITASWCNRVADARSGLTKQLHIKYPCEKMQPARSAVVCILTGGITDESKATYTERYKGVFTARNYIDGAMALGFSLRDNIDPLQTHMLLLAREEFALSLSPEDTIRLQAVGWIIGKAPDFKLDSKHVPKFLRYQTTYTKLAAIGIEEYECVLLMDADTLVIGDIRELLACRIFTQSQHRLAATLNYQRHMWLNFNTGAILWKTSNMEMARVLQISRNGKTMKRFASDQEFLNHVYPERMRIRNKELNKQIAEGDGPVPERADEGSVVNMPWAYNAQTHIEVEYPEYWGKHRSTVKILHFTGKKGWECEERLTEPIPVNASMPNPCKKDPICFCRDAHLYWNALSQAKELADSANYNA